MNLQAVTEKLATRMAKWYLADEHGLKGVYDLMGREEVRRILDKDFQNDEDFRYTDLMSCTDYEIKNLNPFQGLSEEDEMELEFLRLVKKDADFRFEFCDILSKKLETCY